MTETRCDCPCLCQRKSHDVGGNLCISCRFDYHKDGHYSMNWEGKMHGHSPKEHGEKLFK